METGLGINALQSDATLNYMTGTPATDIDGDAYEFRTYYKGWKETQNAYLLEIPLGIRFQKDFNEKPGWTITSGAKVSFPLSCRYKVTGGEIATTGYYSQWNVELTDMSQHGFNTITDRFKGNATINPSYAAYANFGLVYKLSPIVDFYAGAYLNYGFNNMVKSSDKLVYQKDGVYNGVLNSNQADKVRMFTLGLQIGLRWTPGRKKMAEKITVPSAPVDEKAVVLTELKKNEKIPVDTVKTAVVKTVPDSTVVDEKL